MNARGENRESRGRRSLKQETRTRANDESVVARRNLFLIIIPYSIALAKEEQHFSISQLRNFSRCPDATFPLSSLAIRLNKQSLGNAPRIRTR